MDSRIAETKVQSDSGGLSGREMQGGSFVEGSFVEKLGVTDSEHHHCKTKIIVSSWHVLCSVVHKAKIIVSSWHV